MYIRREFDTNDWLRFAYCLFTFSPQTTPDSLGGTGYQR